MLMVREVFIAKPGHAGELAQVMKDEMKSWKSFKGHILLDLVTNYNKVVVEYEMENLSEFDQMMKGYGKEKSGSKQKSEKPKHVDLYQTGRREIYRVVE